MKSGLYDKSDIRISNSVVNTLEKPTFAIHMSFIKYKIFITATSYCTPGGTNLTYILLETGMPLLAY